MSSLQPSQKRIQKSARGLLIMLSKTSLFMPACDIQNLATKPNNTFWDKECLEILGPPILWPPNSLQHHPPSVAQFFTHIGSEMPRVLAGKRHRWYLSGKCCGRTRPKKHKSPIGWPHAVGHVMLCLQHTTQWNYPNKANINSSVLHSNSHGKMQAWCKEICGRTAPVLGPHPGCRMLIQLQQLGRALVAADPFVAWPTPAFTRMEKKGLQMPWKMPTCKGQGQYWSSFTSLLEHIGIFWC